jgi:TetR/AcrR family transcriptional regulator, ethionamide resistance regulator
MNQLTATRTSDRLRAHGDEIGTELAIFDVTEALLAEVALQQVTIAEICARAGASRTTFDLHFSSKYDVVMGLLARVLHEIFPVLQSRVERDDCDDCDVAAGSFGDRFEAAAEVLSAHRAVLRTVTEHWQVVPELKDLWLGFADWFGIADPALLIWLGTAHVTT